MSERESKAEWLPFWDAYLVAEGELKSYGFDIAQGDRKKSKRRVNAIRALLTDEEQEAIEWAINRCIDDAGSYGTPKVAIAISEYAAVTLRNLLGE